MIESLYNDFWPQLTMLALIYILVLFVIFLDLWAGIRKARKRSEYRSSYGYRKTIEKIARYYNTLFVITIIDAVQMLAVWQLKEQTDRALPILPIFTFIGAIFIGFVELKSIYEKSEDKDKAKIADAAALLSKALKDHDTRKTLSSIIDHIKQEQDNKI